MRPGKDAQPAPLKETPLKDTTMRLTIAAIGKIGTKPEAVLVRDYFARLPHQGRLLEFTAPHTEKAKRISEEGQKILGALPAQSKLVALDVKGANLTSRALAARIKDWRDDGVREAIFAIGGADGHSAAVLARADLTLAFGSATWPHLLVRAMLAEQLYRAEMILAKHPYHHE